MHRWRTLPQLFHPHFAQIELELHELGVPLGLFALLPGQNLVNLVQYKYGAAAIELRGCTNQGLNAKSFAAGVGEGLKGAVGKGR
jgi:hypothetical protein